MAKFPGNEVKRRCTGNGESSTSFHCFRHNRAVEMWTFLSNYGHTGRWILSVRATERAKILSLASIPAFGALHAIHRGDVRRRFAWLLGSRSTVYRLGGASATGPEPM